MVSNGSIWSVIVNGIDPCFNFRLILIDADTKWTAPKCGFVSLEEQKTLAISDVPGDQSTASTSSSFKHEQFGKWQTIDQPPSSEATKIDLQLPEKSSIRLIKRPAPDETDREEQIEFGEKTVQIDVHKAKLPTTKLEFKKRKNGSQRNLRQRSDD